MQIDIDENEEEVYEFGTFELVLHKSGSYLLSEEGYFAVSGLDSFLKFDDQYVIINVEDSTSKFFITAEDFEKVKDIYLKYA